MSKKIKIVLITLLVVVSLAISFRAGCVLTTEAPSESDQSLDMVKEAWNIIFDEYVEQDKLDANELIRGAIRGMVEALDDPYSTYLDAETYRLILSDWEGKFEGIGAYVGSSEEGELTIIAPIPDSPAEKAGIQAGDLVLEINGESTSEMSLVDAVIKIRGPKGTAVKLLVLHDGETEPVEIEIIRAEIELFSVFFEMREDIAYIRITNFTMRTNEELTPVLQKISEEAATGIILDLRRNPGGILSTVVEVTSRFLEEGIVFSMVDNQGEKQSTSVKRQGLVTDLPMVVLVDNFSASGSELLAGALQDHDRAIIAGTTTFGKGSVNVPHPLSDGSGIYLTTARWHTPNGRLIEGEGIEPDYPLELEGEDAIQWAIEYLKSNR